MFRFLLIVHSVKLSNKRKYNSKELSKLVIFKFFTRIVKYPYFNYFLNQLKVVKSTLIQNLSLMRDKLYDNADSFAMSFDEEWEKINCEDLKLKIDKVFELLSDHPFLISNPENARKLAEFRIFSLKKFK